jgi:hypothetical protein
MKVTAYGACGGGLCDWGTVPATVYGPNVSATSGAHFQTNQRFLSGDAEFARTALLGRVRSTAGGPRLVVRKLTVFTDGSGRRSFTTVERFAPGKAHVPTTTGHPVSDYPHGLPPAAVAGMFGSWKNASPTGNIVSISVNGSPGAPLVRAWGACSPTPCDMGTARGVTYGSSISSTRGKTMLASYTPGFKNHQLVLRYRRLAGGHEVLTATSYNEFVDGSGRSNYVRTETFVRS